MNREIKFRAYAISIETGDMKMFLPFNLAWFKEGSNAPDNFNTNRAASWDEGTILMQYTGLKDKNGKDIYEGDIVKTTYRDNLPHKGRIYSQPTRLCWAVKHSGYTNQDLFVYSRPDCSVEVIGNIYESPELLK